MLPACSRNSNPTQKLPSPKSPKTQHRRKIGWLSSQGRLCSKHVCGPGTQSAMLTNGLIRCPTIPSGKKKPKWLLSLPLEKPASDRSWVCCCSCCLLRDGWKQLGQGLHVQCRLSLKSCSAHLSLSSAGIAGMQLHSSVQLHKLVAAISQLSYVMLTGKSCNSLP